MGLKEQMEKEEKELKKLSTQGEDEGDEDDSGDEEGAEDEDLDEEEGDSGDEDEGDDDSDDEDDKAKAKKGADDKKGAKKDDKKGADDDKDAKGKKKADADDADPKKKNDMAAQLRAERKKRQKIEEENERLRKAGVQPPVKQVDPKAGAEDKAKPKETAEQRLDRIEAERDREALRNQAVEEFNEIEKEFQQTTPDYEDASSHMIKSMFQGVKNAYPEATDKQALAFVQKRILQIASNAVNRGLNPAEVLYDMSFERYGFQPGQKKTEGKKDGKSKVENLKAIQKNKKRSANAFQGGGHNAGARATLEEASNMDLASFGAMSEAEIDELISQSAE